MSVIDIIIVLVILSGLWQGFRAGLIKSVVALFGWFLALIMGTKLAPLAAPFFESVVQSSVLQTGLGFLAVVLIVLGVVHLLAFLFVRSLQALNLGIVDKLIGGVFGAGKNLLIVLVFLSLVAPALVKMPAWQHSFLAHELMPFAPMAKTMVSKVFGEAWRTVSQLDLDQGSGNQVQDLTDLAQSTPDQPDQIDQESQGQAKNPKKLKSVEERVLEEKSSQVKENPFL